MGALLSNLSKLDSIINPDASESVSTETANTPPKSDETTQTIDSTVVKESDIGVPKETEPTAVDVEKVEEKTKEKEESVASEKKEEGKKVEVEPVDISKTADVIKKPTRKRKRHQMA